MSENNEGNGQGSNGVANDAGSNSTTSWINPDGTFGDYKIAPDEVKGVVEKKRFKSVSDLAKSYSELEKLTGNSIRIPEDKNPERMADIYNKLGRPTEPAGYEYVKPDNVGLELDNTLLDGFKQFAHKAGFNNEQFKGIVDFQIEAIEQANKYEMEQSEAKLQQTWGKDKEIKVKQIVDFANSVGLGEAIIKSGLDRNADLMIALDGLRGKLSEDTLKNGTKTVPSKDERIKAIMSDKAFLDRMHPDHNKLHKEWTNLVTGQA